ncbi:unnamed protein product [Orchesella dallaii]|uniref:F-box domain-containing protein n=1 Tax=Orchesella dallaii TaxID=48710 RepID=A0ABP1RB43_9HEXA
MKAILILKGLSTPKKNSMNGGTRKTCPFNLLPELMDIIFDKLEAADLQTCVNTCTTWSNLLEPEKPLFQFELVLPIILKRLSLDDCLTCRLVCPAWKRSIDHHIENHPSRVNVPEDRGAFPLRPIRHADGPNLFTGRLYGDFGMVIDTVFDFLYRPGKTPQDFLEEMSSHPGNPFVGRNLRMRDNIAEEYWSNTRNILERFGTEFWYACLRFIVLPETNPNNEHEEPHVEQSLQNALALLPKLKWLQLGVNPVIGNDEELSAFETRVRRFLKHNPLPKLEQLETFACDTYFVTPTILLTSVLESCATNRLKRLDLINSHVKFKASFKFPNLEELAIRMELQDLVKLHHTSSHLKKLRLILSNPTDDGFYWPIECEQLFGMLEPFQDSLLELGIRRDSRHIYVIRCHPYFRINFPFLESLGLESDVLPENLEQLVSLKHLEIRNYFGVDRSESFQLKIGCLLPSLKTLDYDGLRCRIKMGRDTATESVVVQNVEDRPFAAAAYSKLRSCEKTLKMEDWSVIASFVIYFIIIFVLVFGTRFLWDLSSGSRNEIEKVEYFLNVLLYTLRRDPFLGVGVGTFSVGMGLLSMLMYFILHRM